MDKEEKPKRNRSAEALIVGRRLVAFEVTQEFDSLITQVAEALKDQMGGRCTRVQALEKMGREGAKKLLRKKKP